MWCRTAVAWVIAALVVCAQASGAASAKSKTARSAAAACAGAHVVATDAASLATASSALLCLVNRERTTRGLGSVRASGQLADAAKGHSSDMVASKFFSHRGLDGTRVMQRVSRTGYPWTALGETLAFGAAQRSTPANLIAMHMQSATHRSVVLERRYRELGVGLVLGMPTRAPAGAASTLALVYGSR